MLLMTVLKYFFIHNQKAIPCKAVGLAFKSPASSRVRIICMSRCSSSWSQVPAWQQIWKPCQWSDCEIAKNCKTIRIRCQVRNVHYEKYLPDLGTHHCKPNIHQWSKGTFSWSLIGLASPTNLLYPPPHIHSKNPQKLINQTSLQMGLSFAQLRFY